MLKDEASKPSVSPTPTNLFAEKFEGGDSDAVIDVRRALDNEAEDYFWRADVLQDSSSHKGARIAAQVKQESFYDGAMWILWVLKMQWDR